MVSMKATIPHSIPTVDISDFLADPTSIQAQDVVHSMRYACSEYGFFYLVGHGIEQVDREKLLSCAKLFGSLSQEQKEEVNVAKSLGMSFRGWEPPALQKHHDEFLPDTKEAFIVGRETPADAPDAGNISTGPNLWPSSIPDEDFRLPIMAYHGRMLQLVGTLLKILARGLPREWKCPDDVFDGLKEKPSAPMRLLNYKPQAVRKSAQFGGMSPSLQTLSNLLDMLTRVVGDHTDFGNVSILLQEEGTEGLEVLHPPTGTWIPVPVVPGSFVINMGDMMQFWTAGYYRSARHRVLTSSTKARHSVAFFLNGNVDLNCAQLDGNGKSMTVGEHIRKRLAETIGGEAGKKMAEEKVH